MQTTKHVFRSEKFRKYLSYDAQDFFENVLNYMQMLKKQ